jgi:hypothetical protein
LNEVVSLLSQNEIIILFTYRWSRSRGCCLLPRTMQGSRD